MSDPRYYLVRALGQSSEAFDLFFENSVVAVGWGKVDFSAIDDPSDLVKQVDDSYYKSIKIVATTRGRRLNAVRRFKNLKARDRIIVPYRGAIRLAIAEAEQVFDLSAGPLDLCNQRKVQYLKTPEGFRNVPRKNLSEGLQRRLRMPGGIVVDLFEFGEEIEALFKGEESGWTNHFTTKEDELMEKFRQKLLGNIQNRKTNLQAGGRGLEELVCELLEVEGYKAKIVSKKDFVAGADADITASRGDRFSGDTKLLIQVKHHQGQTGSQAANQLLRIMEQQPEEYAEHILVVVTTADATTGLETQCENKGIKLIRGPKLVEWIIDCIPNLSLDTLTKLGISTIPRLV